MRIAIDSGGTFTDCVYLEGGQLKVLKLFSTPQQPDQAVLKAATTVAPAGSLKELRHGTTVGTNTMLERTGARVAYVTTAGFEDVIAIGRQARPSLYDWFQSPLPCIVPPALRFGINERVTAEGEILRSPTPEHLSEIGEQIKLGGAKAIALSLLFSFANPENERIVAEALSTLGLPISISHKILPEFREYERASTIVANAYLAPKVGTYLNDLQHAVAAQFPKATVQVMQSSGGIVSASRAAQEPVRTMLSGPAGGVAGAYRVACAAGFSKIIAFDMGGTSTDVSLVDQSAGGPKTTNESFVSGLPISVPMLHIHTVGAGGGSLAHFDDGGFLHVGPKSAGSVPGPICYGTGTGATVSDANLILGRLDPDLFLGGAVRLQAERTRHLMEALRGNLVTVEHFAAGIIRLAEVAMEKAIRVISIERGHDPREFTLVSFGGAGPLHACALARSLGIRQVLVPRMPGALSALGILLSDVVRDYSRTVMTSTAHHRLEPLFLELETQARQDFAEDGFTGSIERTADLRYVGQGYELNVLADLNLIENFHRLHQQHYGYADPNGSVEVVTVRLRVTFPTEAVQLPETLLHHGDGSDAIIKSRRIYFEGEWFEATVYNRDLLRPGDRFHGPALVTEYSATTFLPPHCQAQVDTFGNLVLEII